MRNPRNPMVNGNLFSRLFFGMFYLFIPVSSKSSMAASGADSAFWTGAIVGEADAVLTSVYK